MKWAEDRIAYCERAIATHGKSLADGIPQTLVKAWVEHKSEDAEKIESWLRTQVLPNLIEHCRSEIAKNVPYIRR